MPLQGILAGSVGMNHQTEEHTVTEVMHHRAC